MVAFIFNCSAVNAAGISLGSTRVVFPADSKQVQLTINNSTEKQNYLIQTWIEDFSGNKTSDFIVTPPLFISKSGKESSLNILYTGSRISSGVEKIYYINSKAIPAIEKDNVDNQNTLSLAILTRIKLFLRPQGLSVKPDAAIKMLKANVSGNRITFANSSPYFLSLIDITVGATKIDNIMIPPLSSVTKENSSILKGTIKYKYINDYGAIVSPTQ